jgi:hypothetical protein
VRRFPYPIALFVIVVVLALGGAFFYFRSGGSDADSTPVSDGDAAAAITAVPPASLPTMAEAVPIATETARVLSTVAPAATNADPTPAASTTVAEGGSLSTNAELPPTPLPTLVDAVTIVTETPRVLATFTPAAPAVALAPTALPTLVEVSSMYSADAPVDTPIDIPADTSLIDLPGEATELPIVMISPVRQEDLGAAPNVQMPPGPVAANELYVAYGNIYGTGQCAVHVFQPGELLTGLSTAPWRLVRISGGIPDQREALVQNIQAEAAADPSAGGSCPFG